MTQEFESNQPSGGQLRAPTGGDPPPAGPPQPPPELESPARPAPSRRRLFGLPVRTGALITLAIVAGVVAFLVLRDNGSDKATIATPPGSGARAATLGDLVGLADNLGHPVYWLGPRSGETYELTQTANGKVYIRYLPEGADVGSSTQYLTVATYPFPGAFAAIERVAKTAGSDAAHLPNGGLAVLDKSHPTSVHAAYPGVDYQVEIFDPTPNAAMQAVLSGRLSSLGPQPAEGASLDDLKAAAASLGHPVYWAGPKPGYTYELSHSSTGRTYVRYLPMGVEVGSKDPYLTVATYPFPNALKALQQSTKGTQADTIELPGGGLAVVDASSPTSIHLAYPDADVQVEVFDPSPAQARQVATSGEIAAVF
jgi:hypothetical protein